MLSRATVVVIAGLLICKSLGAGTEAQSKGDSEQDAKGWEYSFENLTYLAQHERDYDNPNFTADYDHLHLEARYNYEALKTGSVWVGYKFDVEKKLRIGRKLKLAEPLTFEATPMVGGVFGDLTGIAPGYLIEISYKDIELSTQAEYFFDAGTRSGDFFYSWSELSAPLPRIDCLHAGLVIERTQASGNSDVRRGPLIGFTHKFRGQDVELTTYWLAPGSRNATFVFAVKLDFK